MKQVGAMRLSRTTVYSYSEGVIQYTMNTAAGKIQPLKDLFALENHLARRAIVKIINACFITGVRDADKCVRGEGA